MSVLLETSVGDLVVDLDVEGSPLLVKNFLRLCQARYYTKTLLHTVVPGRCVYGGDPRGDGTGGACADALLRQFEKDASYDEEALLKSQARFLSSQGRRLTAAECREKGRLVAVELQGLANTVGSQFVLTVGEGPDQALDGYTPNSTAMDVDASARSSGWLSLGKVVEDTDHVLDQLNRTYVDAAGRPFADIRLRRALTVYNPFPEALLWPLPFLKKRGIDVKEDYGNNDTDLRVLRSPSPERPSSEAVDPRIPMEEVLDELKDETGVDGEVDEEALHRRLRVEAESDRRQEDRSRARVLEMLGDLPDAEASAPKNVLFIAKLNSITTDEDLQLIFSRFDSEVTVDIIRDNDTGQSLQYAFAAFRTEKQAVEAYFKMNQALVDDRRIMVDFSQSVSHVWDKYRQRFRDMPKANSFSATGPRNTGPKEPHRPGNNKRREHPRENREMGRPMNQHRGPRERKDEGRPRHRDAEMDSRQLARGRQGDDRDVRRGDDHANDSGRREFKARDRSRSREHRSSRRHDSDDEGRRHRPEDRRYGAGEEELRHRRKERYESSDYDERGRHRRERRLSADRDEDRRSRRKEKHSRRDRYDSDDEGSKDDSRKERKRRKKHRSDRDDGNERNRDRSRHAEEDERRRHRKRDRHSGDRNGDENGSDRKHKDRPRHDSEDERRPREREREDKGGDRHR
jgi:peptidyl-prolyl cis-trans isomerase-like 4